MFVELTLGESVKLNSTEVELIVRLNSTPSGLSRIYFEISGNIEKN